MPEPGLGYALLELLSIFTRLIASGITIWGFYRAWVRKPKPRYPTVALTAPKIVRLEE